jgi:hypothetical protein
MDEGFLRGGFASAFWITGRQLGRAYYYAGGMSGTMFSLGTDILP